MKVQKSHLRLALFALGAAVLYNVWFFALRPGPRPAVRAAADQPPFGVPGFTAGATALDPAAIPAPPGIDMLASPSWRRDPFLFGDETRRVTAAMLPQSAPPAPVVRSILFSADRRLAIVDGRIVGVGDAVGRYTVSAIEQGTVEFTTAAGERFRVSVHAPPEAGLTR